MEQGNSLNKVYFFHIPKTSGRYFYANSILLLEHEFLTMGRQYGGIVNGYGHLSFKPIDTEKCLSFSILREPVARTISHYQHIYNIRLNKDINEYKKDFFEFLENNPNKDIFNYQTKFISYNGNETIVDIDGKCLKESLDSKDIDLAKNRLSKIDYLLKMEDTSLETIKKCWSEMRKYLGLNIEKDHFSGYIKDIINPNSALFLKSLTKQEFARIEDMMSIDCEIYHSSRYFKPVLY